MRKTTRERRFWWHWQNLTLDDLRTKCDEQLREALDDLLTFESVDLRWRTVQALERVVSKSLRRGVPAFHGRAWLYAPPMPWRRREHTTFHVEWGLGGRSCRASFGVAEWGGDEDDLQLSVALPFLGHFYAGVEGILPSRWLPKGGRDLSVRVHDGCIWLDLWATPDEWSKRRDWRDPSSSVRQPVLHVVDRLLGKTRYQAREVLTIETALVMPEASYPVRLTFSDCTWSRARWPWAKRLRRVEAALHTPLPIPGKGENSWDCDDDAIYSSTFPASTMHEALAHLAKSTTKTRRRYGGQNWTPAQEVT
jgi:hypothetical protein